MKSLITFAPNKGYTSGPCGLIYVNNIYHLFYQHSYYSRWRDLLGWGHAISSDLVNWQEIGEAMPYDNDRYEERFTGSIVHDKENTIGLTKTEHGYFVAIYTSTFKEDIKLPNNFEMKKNGQYQSLAYTEDIDKTWKIHIQNQLIEKTPQTDKTWIDYFMNPVIQSPPWYYIQGTDAFEGPKVFWYDAGMKWVMLVALRLHSRILFYESTNLTKWKYTGSYFTKGESVFIKCSCPDLRKMKVNSLGEEKWVLIYSGMYIYKFQRQDPKPQAYMYYVIGDFDGKKFTSDKVSHKCLDYGKNFFAGTTWNNVSERILMIGWINSWYFAKKIMSKYRGGLSLVRELTLTKKGNEYILLQNPVKEIYTYIKEERTYNKANMENGIEIKANNAYNFKIEGITSVSFSLVIEDIAENTKDKKVYEELARINYKPNGKNIISIFKRNSYEMGFENEIPVEHEAPIDDNFKNFNIFIDHIALTVFYNDGSIVFTELLISKDKDRKLRFFGEVDIKVKMLLLGMP